jgi:pyruvate kinase
MIKTKIIATLGPASGKLEMIKALAYNGVDVFRLNFSHGTLDQHKEVLGNLNDIRSEFSHAVAVMGDLCGPKIRTGPVEPEGEKLNDGDEVTIRPGDESGTAHCFGTNYEHFSRDVKIGQRIFIDDGQIILQVQRDDGDRKICSVLVGGLLYSRKGINLPDTEVSVPSITERDWQCVDWAIEHQLDYLALSFVRSADEIQQLKDYLKRADSDIKVVAKIEKPQAVEDLESIVRVSDAVLVARGDLGVEMDLAEVPLIQKRITRLCLRLGKPVIVATQMLQSMIDSPTPTRAEVNDVANAILDLTDAVMLSGETAVGSYPIAAVQTIRKIARVTEAYLDQANEPRPKIDTSQELAITAAMARSVAQIVDDTDAKLVAVWSQNGAAARLLSKARIDEPILAMSSDKRICRQMALHYGVIPRCQPVPEDISQLTQMVDKIILQREWAQVGDQIVLVAGRPLGATGTTNAILMHTITASK